MQLHVVFKSHLDVGFTDLAANVVEDYLHFYIPRAITLSRRMRELGRERFIWTTGSWLIYEYLRTRSTTECANMERAIADGDIAWHALPFTMHSELTDAALFAEGLFISRELDARFGKKTIAAKVTDVSGHTRAIVPLLAQAGVRFLHNGVNGGIKVPDVPEMFRWQDEATKSEVIFLQHQGYGGVRIDGDLGLQVECTSENDPCPSIQAFVPLLMNLEKKYPGAKAFGSTLDAYAKALVAQNPDLPVVTSEIGDSWIRGAGSAPHKLARYRELLRLNRKWISFSGAEAVRPFSRKLLLIAEHTWGLDTIMCMQDETSYKPVEFQKARETGRFSMFEASWQEQEDYVNAAIAELDPERAEEARRQLEQKPAWPDAGLFSKIEAGEVIVTDHFEVAIDPRSGAINHLKAGGRLWADEAHQLFGFSHQLFSVEQMEQYMDDYASPWMRKEWWLACALARRDLTQLQGIGGCWSATFSGALHLKNGEGTYLQVNLARPKDAPSGYGFPEALYLRLFFPKAAPVLEAAVGWEVKDACRHPEAIWTHLNPLVSDSKAWRVDKLGQQISPFDVVKRAGAHLHAAGEEVSCRGKERTTIRPIDAPLVSFGERGILKADDGETSADGGLYFNLWNNTWGTNFPLWLSGKGSFRFVLEFAS